MLTTLASSELLRIDKRLSKAADLSEVESDLGRGDVLGQCVNFVLETIPLKGLFGLAVKTGENPIDLRAGVWVDSALTGGTNKGPAYYGEGSPVFYSITLTKCT